ncbi:MAG: hypothetical protein ABSC31_00270 [Acidimicrobiales bacterium]|jgi:hypothetical protein
MGAGALFHKDEVRRAIGTWGTIVMANLQIEAEGQYAGAVRVYVGDMMVASIPHGLGDPFRDAITQLRADGRPATLRIRLEDDGEYVNVWLPSKVKVPLQGGAFLSGFGGADVKLDPGQAESLDASLHSVAKTKRISRVGGLIRIEDSWRVMLDKELIGSLDKGQTYPYVEAAERAGFPLTCDVLIKREPARPLSVSVNLPG